MMNMGMRAPIPQQQGGMDTGAQNPEMLLKMLMTQQMEQGPQTTPMRMPVRDPKSFPPQNPNVGTLPQQGLPITRFDQSAQPGLASIAPRNIPSPEPMGPSSPLQDMYKIPRSLAR